MYIYADNAATTKMSDAALDVLIPCLREQYGNPSSLHSPGQRAAEILQEARQQTARAINADPGEIFFTSGGSEADNMALFSLAHVGKARGKTKIVSTAFEHHAVLHTLDRLKEEGFEIVLLPVHENGIVRPEEAETVLDDKTALLSVMTVNNEIGTVQPIKELGAVCRENGVFFHTDAVQAVGHIPVDVREMNVDMLSASGHKFGGPKGVGFLYVRKGVPIRPLINGGQQERGKRAGTENVPALAAMAAALEDSVSRLPETMPHVTALRERLISGLSAIPHSRLNGDRAARVPGTVNFCFEGIEGESLLLLLDEAGIAASSGSACTSGSLDPSHVLLSLGLCHEVAHGSLRLSVNESNTIEEMDYIVNKTAEVVSYLRSISPMWDSIERGDIPHLI